MRVRGDFWRKREVRPPRFPPRARAVSGFGGAWTDPEVPTVTLRGVVVLIRCSTR